jgi:hypothetical protein
MDKVEQLFLEMEEVRSVVLEHGRICSLYFKMHLIHILNLKEN